eukprot:365895-Chlamydomonas_euryale.AAC.5
MPAWAAAAGPLGWLALMHPERDWRRARYWRANRCPDRSVLDGAATSPSGFDGVATSPNGFAAAIAPRPGLPGRMGSSSSGSSSGSSGSSCSRAGCGSSRAWSPPCTPLWRLLHALCGAG